MRKLLLPAIILLCICNLHAQFSTNQLQFRIGYNIHNTGASSINHLIEAFNNKRYPATIATNLPSVHFPRGIVIGGNYKFRDDMIFYGVFKNRRQFVQTGFVSTAHYRQYCFRAITVELGLMVPLRDDDFFSHFVGGGLLLGSMAAYTNWTTKPEYPGASKMVNIDNSSIIGLSAVYEAQLRLHRYLRIFIRPVAQFSLKTPIRKLTNFFDPQVDASGKVTYGEGEPEKYDRAGFNGIGIEGGLLFLLPEL